MPRKQTFAIANIVRAEIITEEATPRTFVFDTASKCDVEAFTSEGQEQELRTKNTIHSQNNTEDIVKGYNLTLTDNKFAPDVFALVDGGTLTEDEENETFEYNGPVMGSVVSRTKFTLNLYSEEKDVDGETISYLKWPFKHCKGTPVTPSFEDGVFITPEYTIKARPKFGEAALGVSQLTELPAIV